MMLDKESYCLKFLLGHTNTTEIADRLKRRPVRVPLQAFTLTDIVKQESRNEHRHVLGFRQHFREAAASGISLRSQCVQVSNCDERVFVNRIPVVEVSH